MHTRGSKKVARKWNMTPRAGGLQQVGQHWVIKAGALWQLSVASQLDIKKILKIITKDYGVSEKKQDWVCWASRWSWPRGTSLYLNNHPIHLILFHVTFFLFLISRRSWRCGDHQEGCNNRACRRIPWAKHDREGWQSAQGGSLWRGLYVVCCLELK